jgi:hypothetical protein
MKNSMKVFLSLMASVLLLSSCKKENTRGNDELQIYTSAVADLAPGKASSWLKVDKLGAPLELSLEINREALYNLPNTNFSAVVPLPAKAKEITPFDHIQIDWASQGHGIAGPNGPFHMGPHYDVRFYMTTEAERLAIPAPTDPTAKFNVHPPAGYMPSNYYAGLSALPQIGLHWHDFGGFPGITKALLLGTYNGKFIFVSPAVTVEELRTGNRSSTSYGQPEKFHKTNTYYPTKYNIYADDAKQKHQISLDDFVLR